MLEEVEGERNWERKMHEQNTDEGSEWQNRCWWWQTGEEGEEGERGEGGEERKVGQSV